LLESQSNFLVIPGFLKRKTKAYFLLAYFEITNAWGKRGRKIKASDIIRDFRRNYSLFYPHSSLKIH